MKKFKDLMGHVRMEEAVKNDPCWKGYEMVGMKDKNGKKVPNCVPTKEEVEIDEAMSNDDKSSVALRALVAKKNLKNSEGKVKSVDFLVKMKNRVKAGKDLQKEEVVNEADKDPGEYDQEGDMAMTQLRSIIYHAQELHDQLDKNDNLPEWVQSKITLAQDYMQTACDYMYSQKNESVEHLEEGRPSQRHPLEGHEYHRKTDAELVYIAKDAHKAAEAMKSHNTAAENKYRDQANDSATVRYYRQKHGMADWYKKKYGHIKEDVVEEGTKSPGVGWMLKADPKLGEKVKANKDKYKEFKQNVGKKEDNKLQKEESEQINELSDKTLTSYAQKVHDDSLKHDKDPSKRSAEKRNKSVMGFSRAINKLEARPQNEEVEQLDEISSDTLKSYVKKANASIKSDIKSGNASNKTDDRHDNLMKAKQRLSGSAGGLRDRKYTAEGTEQVDEAMSASFRMALALKREKEKREEKDKAREARGDRFTTGPAQKPTPVQSHVTAESVNEQTASKLGQEREEVPFDKPYKTTKKDGTVTDKSGAVHTPMSRAKHLAKMAARKAGGIKEESEPDDSYQKNDTLAKRSLSKTAGMVKDLAKNAKTKKGSKADDKFEPEPELSSQIVKV